MSAEITAEITAEELLNHLARISAEAQVANPGSYSASDARAAHRAAQRAFYGLLEETYRERTMSVHVCQVDESAGGR